MISPGVELICGEQKGEKIEEEQGRREDREEEIRD